MNTRNNKEKKDSATSTVREDTDDDLILPSVAEDHADRGAAADSLDTDEELKLPRILRYALRGERNLLDARLCLFAEIMEVASDLPHANSWLDDPDPKTHVTLARALDRLAVGKDTPDCRSLADSLRLLTLPVPQAGKLPPGYARVAKTLLRAFRECPGGRLGNFWSTLEEIVYGWAALPLLKHDVPKGWDAAIHAAKYVGNHMADRRVARARRDVERILEDEKPDWPISDGVDADKPEPAEPEVPDGHLVVCRMDGAARKNSKLKDIIAPLKHALDEPLPLIAVPPLHEVRSKLLFEFPYAEKAIDFVLNDLVGKQTIQLRPAILVGEPGGGKSRFVRRLSEVLGLGVWRTDASRSDGAAFAGTDKRWYSAEPCHPFLAIAQAKQANPLILIDEIEKAGTRSDYGRFWDCLLGFLEPETAARYPDPALQTTLDLSQVSYVATANSLDPIPSPLRDRFRIVEFPKPRAQDLDVLLPPIIAEIAAERGLDARWLAPLAGWQRDLLTERWKGGSVRRLRRLIEVLLRARDKDEAKH